jgi:uncharacterized protein with von Willebrand factor type A (vWA) domain
MNAVRHSIPSTIEYLEDEVTRLSEQLERAVDLLDKYKNRRNEALTAAQAIERKAIELIQMMDDLPESVFTELSDNELTDLRQWLEVQTIKFDRVREERLEHREDILAASVRVVVPA